jgi:FdhD protein
MTGGGDPVVRVAAESWRHGQRQDGVRALPEEVAVALSYDRETFAVMMASPADLQDFATGFSLCEGIITTPAEILSFEAIVVDEGVECRMTLAAQTRAALAARRRRIAGPVGCGLCGMDSLKEAARPLPRLEVRNTFAADAIAAAFQEMKQRQRLNAATHAVHAAAFFRPGQALLVREDIGRHNALDKMIGAAAHAGLHGNTGAILLTSRVSLDLIQKAATFGCAVVAAISVPTALAVRAAQDAGLTLIAVARDDGFEIFSHPDRVVF